MADPHLGKDLDGPGLLNRNEARAEMARDSRFKAFARDTVDFLAKRAQDVANRALGHCAYLVHIGQEAAKE